MGYWNYVTPTIPFNIFIDPRYNQVKLANDELTLCNFDARLGKSINKFDVFFYSRRMKDDGIINCQ
jgi:hypothetical protein